MPAARPEIAVERHFGALLARGFEQGKKAADAVIGIERQRDAREIDQPRRHQALRDPHPVRQLEQVARRRAIAPIANAALAGGTILNKAKPRQPARHAQHQVRGNPFGGGERHDAVRIAVVAERGGERDIDAGAGEINGGIERVPAAGQPEPAVGPTRQFDQRLRRRRQCGLFARSSVAHGSALRTLGPPRINTSSRRAGRRSDYPFARCRPVGNPEM